jgi:hypothetical protein
MRGIIGPVSNSTEQPPSAIVCLYSGLYSAFNKSKVINVFILKYLLIVCLQLMLVITIVSSYYCRYSSLEPDLSGVQLAAVEMNLIELTTKDVCHLLRSNGLSEETLDIFSGITS